MSSLLHATQLRSGTPLGRHPSLRARVLLLMMNHTFHTYAALAITPGQPGVTTPYKTSATVHGYTSQTRSDHHLHLAGLLCCMQADSATLLASGCLLCRQS
jgi:hypothetical protein